MCPIFNLGPLPYLALLLDPKALKADARRVVCRTVHRTVLGMANLLDQPLLVRDCLRDRFRALLNGRSL